MPTEFIVKHEHVSKGRSSYMATYRKRKQKDGTYKVECTGFDTKVYADSIEEFKKAQAELEDLGVEKLKKFAADAEGEPTGPLA